MLDRRGHLLPVACAGISPRRLGFWALIATSMAIWIGLIVLIHRLF